MWEAEVNRVCESHTALLPSAGKMPDIENRPMDTGRGEQLALVSQQAPDLIGKLLHLYGDYLCVLSQLQHAGHCLLVQLDQLDTSTACCVCLEGFAAFSQVGSFQFSSVQSLSHVRFFVTP